MLQKAGKVRSFQLQIPDAFVSPTKASRKTFDVGTLNLEVSAGSVVHQTGACSAGLPRRGHHRRTQDGLKPSTGQIQHHIIVLLITLDKKRNANPT